MCGNVPFGIIVRILHVSPQNHLRNSLCGRHQWGNEMPKNLYTASVCGGKKEERVLPFSY